jgi:hypothetical protein
MGIGSWPSHSTGHMHAWLVTRSSVSIVGVRQVYLGGQLIFVPMAEWVIWELWVQLLINWQSHDHEVAQPHVGMRSLPPAAPTVAAPAAASTSVRAVFWAVVCTGMVSHTWLASRTTH